MSKWKMVPVELTPEMFRAMAGAEGCEGRYSVAIAAAPKWEPSDEDIRRANRAFQRAPANDRVGAWRAAILAAVRGEP